MAKLKGGRRKAKGFRCYINFFPDQAKRVLKREGVIRYVDEDGRPYAQHQFDYLDEIPGKVRKRPVGFEKKK